MYQPSKSLSLLCPQALEWAFSLAAGFRFQVSVDNLGGIAIDREGFTRRVRGELMRYRERGLPPRARRFYERLREFYGVEPVWPDAEAA